MRGGEGGMIEGAKGVNKWYLRRNVGVGGRESGG